MIRLTKTLKNEITSYDRYVSGELKFILNGSDNIVKDFYSYAEWINRYHEFSTIKVEGITLSAREARYFGVKIKDVHLFFSQHSGYSFHWHKDSVNVILMVLKGKKMVWIRNKKYRLGAGQQVGIRRGELHRVQSKENTWALSIGY